MWFYIFNLVFVFDYVFENLILECNRWFLFFQIRWSCSSGRRFQKRFFRFYTIKNIFWNAIEFIKIEIMLTINTRIELFNWTKYALHNILAFLKVNNIFCIFRHLFNQWNHRLAISVISYLGCCSYINHACVILKQSDLLLLESLLFSNETINISKALLQVSQIFISIIMICQIVNYLLFIINYVLKLLYCVWLCFNFLFEWGYFSDLVLNWNFKLF